MAEQSPLFHSLTTFLCSASRTIDPTELLHDLTLQVTSGVGAAGAGVALRAADGLRLATADTDVVASVDRLQDEDGQGPRSEAVRRHAPVAAADLRQCTGRWPEYASRALEAGFVSVVAVPMCAGDEVIGALDLYDRHPRRWSADDLEAADLFLDVATGCAGTALRLDEQERRILQLEHALDSRIVIEQAKGVISADRSVSVDEAFEVLRRHANNHNAKLHDVADAVVCLGLRPD